MYWSNTSVNISKFLLSNIWTSAFLWAVVLLHIEEIKLTWFVILRKWYDFRRFAFFMNILKHTCYLWDLKNKNLFQHQLRFQGNLTLNRALFRRLVYLIGERSSTQNETSKYQISSRTSAIQTWIVIDSEVLKNAKRT